MNSFENFLTLLQTKMERPLPYGWYHWLWLGLTAATLVILILLRKHNGEKQLKWFLAIYGIVAAITELLKQLSWSFSWDGGAVWDYQWYAAPFQLCSTPIYLSLICLFLKRGKLRNSLLSYLSLVSIIGGFMTIILPHSCFCSDILANVHTMWLHCGSFVLGVYLLMSGNVQLTKQSWLRAAMVFLILAATALAMNIGVYQSGILNGETFNMFYISPYFESVLPVFIDIQKAVPYPIFLGLYLIAVLLGSGLVFWLAKGITAEINKCKQRVLLHTR